MRIAAILPILSLLLLLFGGCKAEPADVGVPRSETAPALRESRLKNDKCRKKAEGPPLRFSYSG